MTQPTIFFCPRKDSLALLSATGMFLMSGPRQKEGLELLRQGKSIIVTEDVELMGWEAPENTHMVFLEGFPTDGPIREQAEGRVRRIYPTREEPLTEADLIIDGLGGTSAVSHMTNIPTSTVHSWRKNGIPESRLDHLKLAAKEAGKEWPVVNEPGVITNPSVLIDLLDKNNLFHTTDGVTRFMIRGSGTIDANDLRTIADELDKRNGVNRG